MKWPFDPPSSSSLVIVPTQNKASNTCASYANNIRDALCHMSGCSLGHWGFDHLERKKKVP